MNAPRRCTDCSQQFTDGLDSPAGTGAPSIGPGASRGGLLDRIAPRTPDGRILHILPPTRCPACRLKRRLLFRNQIFVCLRPSSTTGKTIFSMYGPEAPFPVIERETWWSDAWDPLAYGRPFDFSRTFFEQFTELRNAVPHFPLSVVNVENSDYSNNCGDLKNCYFVFNATNCEDSLYCDSVSNTKNSVECTFCSNAELCYDCIDCTDCYNLQSSQGCEQCRDSFFLLNCRGCSNCIGCVNLRRAEYCIFNRQVTKEEFERFRARIKLHEHTARETFARQCDSFFQKHPRPHVVGRRIENSVGDYLYSVNNVQSSFIIREGENLSHCFNLQMGARDCRDVSLFGGDAELMYECVVTGMNASRLRFCYDCWDGVTELSYCWMCMNSHDLFGCVGVRKKSYCVLNRQYDAKDYHDLVTRIVEHMRATGEWGEFFPAALSPFAYNHTIAHRYFPSTKEETTRKGLRWAEGEPRPVSAAVAAAALPEGLPADDAPMTVLSALSGRPFRVTGAELQRYRALRVPLPRWTYDERMEQRARRLGGIQLFQRPCQKTGKVLLTTWRPDSPQLIWDRDEYVREFES